MLLRYAGFVDFGLSEGEGTALCDWLAVPASSTFVVLAERNIQLALAGKAALVGSFAYDTDTEIMQISEGYAAIHGFPEGTVEKARSECLADVHPDDIGQVTQLRSEAFRERRREYKVEYRIFRAGGEVRWVETRCFITYSGEGRPHRVVGVSIDITERKYACWWLSSTIA